MSLQQFQDDYNEKTQLLWTPTGIEATYDLYNQCFYLFIFHSEHRS